LIARIPFYQALNKPPFFMGGERELMMMSGLMSAAMIFVGLTFQSISLGIASWIVTSTALRMMAKKDPLMSKIYMRQLKLQKYYRAKSSIFKD